MSDFKSLLANIYKKNEQPKMKRDSLEKTEDGVPSKRRRTKPTSTVDPELEKIKNQLTIGLNQGQREIYNLIMNEKKEGPLKLFITGKAGTGKSHLIRALALNSGFGVVSPTAASAKVMGGQTIHSFFKIRPYDNYYKDNPIDSAVKQKINAISTLIIDEISMVRPCLLDVMETICRKARGEDEFFGGMNILLFGDFCQLLPIFEPGEDKRLLFEYELWSKFEQKILTENMRQRDEEYIINLNRIRMGIELEIAVNYFNNFYDPDIDSMSIEERHQTTFLVPRKAMAQNINMMIMLWFHENHTGEGTLISRQKTPVTYVPREKMNSVIKFADIDSILPNDLVIYKGMRFMVTKNLNPLIYNGLIVTVEDIVSVKRGDDCIDQIRVSYDGKSTFIFDGLYSFYTYDGGKPFKIDGLPLNYAYASTINKCQGLSLPSAVVDLRGSFGAGMVYVALSRVSDITKLKLASKLEMNEIIIDSRVLNVYTKYTCQ
ncbi:MAG: ATP-dependent DNA helicase [Janthinobacterium lividum]